MNLVSNQSLSNTQVLWPHKHQLISSQREDRMVANVKQASGRFFTSRNSITEVEGWWRHIVESPANYKPCLKPPHPPPPVLRFQCFSRTPGGVGSIWNMIKWCLRYLGECSPVFNTLNYTGQVNSRATVGMFISEIYLFTFFILIGCVCLSSSLPPSGVWDYSPVKHIQQDTAVPRSPPKIANTLCVNPNLHRLGNNWPGWCATMIMLKSSE